MQRLISAADSRLQKATNPKLSIKINKVSTVINIKIQSEQTS
jgi:hypothetical protein